MNTVETEILGVHLTLVGLFIVVFFESVDPYPLVGFLLGIAGTAIVLMALLTGRWD